MNEYFKAGFEKKAGLKEGLTTLKLVFRKGPKKAKETIGRLENLRHVRAKDAATARLKRMKSPSKYNN